MSYTVFALKWRPKNFDEIVGQGHIVTTLKSALEKNRIAHAYLFAGPRGVGKTSAARILAKALNCKEGPTANPCQKCDSCLAINQGNNFDVIEIDGASNRQIDDIRTLRENVKFAPTRGKFKIYIIDEVHMLTTEAFNALLKTLEEPPEFVKFVFATTHPHKVPPTILSRCQRLDFNRIPVMEIISQLEKIAAIEHIQVDRDVLFAIAKASDGSLRDAESVLDQLVSFSKERISLKDVICVLGLIEQEALFQITERIIQKDAKGALGIFNSLVNEGKDMGVFLANLIEHFRNLMITKVCQADSKLVDLPQEICDKLLEQSQSFSLEEIFSAFNILVNTQEMAKRLESLRIPFEISLVKLAHDKKGRAAEPMPPPKDNKQMPVIEQVKKNQDPPPPPSMMPAGIASLDNIKDSWQGLLDNLGKIKMSLATYLSEGTLFNLKDDVISISFPKNFSFHKEILEKKENKTIIEKSLSELLNCNLRVSFMLSKEERQKEDTDEQPFIKSALKAFNGRVIKEE